MPSIIELNDIFQRILFGEIDFANKDDRQFMVSFSQLWLSSRKLEQKKVLLASAIKAIRLYTPSH